MALLALAPIRAQGQATQKLRYSGVITDSSGYLIEGDYTLTFRIYSSPSGGTALYTESIAKYVDNGEFDVILGSTTAIPNSVFASSAAYISVQASGQSESADREPLGLSPYATTASQLSSGTDVTISAGVSVATFTSSGDFRVPLTVIAQSYQGDGSSLTGITVGANAITTPKIAADAVTSAAILTASVTTSKLAADAVTASAILNGVVTTPKLATDAVTSVAILTGAATTNKLGTDAVTTSAILTASVTTPKLAVDAVTAAAILNQTITSQKIANGAITSAQIANAAITTAQIASDAVTSAKILDAAIVTSKLATDALTTASILDGAITTNKLATDSVTTAKILSSAVTTPKLGVDSVNTTAILNGAVTTTKIGILQKTALTRAIMMSATVPTSYDPSLTVRTVGLFDLAYQITVNQLTFNVNNGGNSGTTKICIYDDAGKKLIDVTSTASTNGANSATVSPAVTLYPGQFYVAAGDASAGNGANISVWNTPPVSGFNSNTPSSKLDYEGTVTHASGGCDATLGTITPAQDSTPVVRLDN